MLRITTDDRSDSLNFQLEGTLAGPWVKEFEECWTIARASRGAEIVRVDLRGVTSIDRAGRELLTAMHAQGVQFLCSGCSTRALVAEITRGAACQANRDERPSPGIES